MTIASMDGVGCCWIFAPGLWRESLVFTTPRDEKIWLYVDNTANPDYTLCDVLDKHCSDLTNSLLSVGFNISHETMSVFFSLTKNSVTKSVQSQYLQEGGWTILGDGYNPTFVENCHYQRRITLMEKKFRGHVRWLLHLRMCSHLAKQTLDEKGNGDEGEPGIRLADGHCPREHIVYGEQERARQRGSHISIEILKLV